MGRSCYFRVSAGFKIFAPIVPSIFHARKFYCNLLPLVLLLIIFIVLFNTPCSSQMVGVIVRLEKEAFKVLTQHGKELHVPQHTVQKRNNRAVALDMNQVSLTMLYLYFISIYFGIRILFLLEIL